VAPLRLGSIAIDVACYGFAPLDLADECPGQRIDWDAERAVHPWAFHDATSWPWHVHAFVARGPWGTAVLDTGVGAYPPYRPWASGTGFTAEEAFARIEVDPDEVGLVVLSHLHADHAGGVWAGEAPRFPAARHVLHEADAAFFGDGHEPYAAVAEIEGLRGLGLLDTDPADREVAPGVRVVHTPGHTPGHRSTLLEAGDDVVLITGDLLHVPIQAANPRWASSHDEDPPAGAVSRAAMLGRARDGSWTVAVPHFARPFGSLGPQGWRSTGPAGEGSDVR
jgi:glyoxylase-like metal-dependent hydrolase (beta-lactamase superfamily II)